MAQNLDFLNPKWPLNMFFGAISWKSMYLTMWNPKISHTLVILEDIQHMEAIFPEKRVPRLKIAISKNH